MTNIEGWARGVKDTADGMCDTSRPAVLRLSSV